MRIVLSCTFNFIRSQIYRIKSLRRIIAYLVVFSLVIPAGAIPQEINPAPAQIKKASIPTISLEVKGMDVVDALKIIADKGDLNLSISGNVRGRITLFLKNVDIWSALDIIVVSADLAYEINNNIIYVMTERDYETKYGKKYWDKRIMQAFGLKYAKAQKAQAIVSQIASKIGKIITDESTNTLIAVDTPDRIELIKDVIKRLDKPIETKVFDLDYLPVDKVEKKISEMLSANSGIIKIDEATNKILIADYPENIIKIERMIKAFDEKPLQVLIDAKIIEIAPSKKFYTGINWDYWITKYFRTKGDFAIPSGVNEKVRFGTIGVADVAAKDDYSAIIDFLEIFGDSKILSSPRIVVLNNEEAKIIVGTRDAYITSMSSEIGDSLTTAQTVNFVDVGVKLFVTPTINKAGYITMKIKPEISSSERETLTTEDKQTEVPIVTTSEAETTVIVKDGVSIIMGGLRKITRTKERKQIPVLGGIPGIGAFFRSKKEESTKNELVIVLTPRIVSGDRAIEEELRDKIMGTIWEKEAIKEFGTLEKIIKQEDKPPVVIMPNKEKPPVIEDKKKDAMPLKKSKIVKKPEKELAKKEKEVIKKEKPAEAESLEPLTVVPLSVKPKEMPEPVNAGSYYLEIADKIREKAARMASKMPIFSEEEQISKSEKPSKESKIKLPLKVKVRFVVSKEGGLVGEPVVVAADSNGNLKSFAREIIKESSPFPAFPASEKANLQTFEITLIF
ncbi:MAG: secretin N-terminal domain-containing protein [Candidatus Omnitrophota bacterium]